VTTIDGGRGTQSTPEGYLGAEARISSGPAPALVEAGYALELADAPMLHHGLGLADLAHVLELHEVGVIPPEQSAALLPALLEMLDIPADEFPYDPVYGDAYNSRERELERRLGNVAGWLHTGRTRREAGRIAFRFAVRERILDLHQATTQLISAIAEQSSAHADSVWADTTYLQPAQPSTFGHYLGGFGEEAVRHLDRLEQAYRWADQSPAGVGGVGGSRVPMDRERLARSLGFAAPGAHTRDAMWAVDWLADTVVAATQAATTVDRLAEDLEIFTSPGFGYVTLDASLCRASVLMPQKRNPYALAVIRSGAGTLIGRATGLLVTQRTPSARTDNWLHAYREVAGSLELASQVVTLGAEVVRTLDVHRDVLVAAAGQNFTGATDLAEELVLRYGLDYRSAYRVVGRAAAQAVEHGRTFLTDEDVTQAATELLGEPVHLSRPGDGAESLLEVLDPTRIVSRRTVLGGSAPERVRDHRDALGRRLTEANRWREERLEHARQTELSLIAAARVVTAGADIAVDWR
jgi:argininosuccinate lyase